MTINLTNAEIAILGLIIESPRHGYDLEQCIKERGMRQWTEIGFSSIYYILNKLERGGFLKSERKGDDNRPSRKEYDITEAGLDVFRRVVFTRLSTPRPHSADFDLGLANMAVLHPQERHSALTIHRDNLRSQLEQVLMKWDRDGRGILPSHVEALFDHSVAAIQAELSWVDHFIEKNQDMEKNRRNHD
jgi:DNA-binding PadR family transcriptional regulator